MPFPTTLTVRRDQLVRAVRSLDADDLRVLVHVVTIATDAGQACFAIERIAGDLRCGSEHIVAALARLRAADFVEPVMACPSSLAAVELGPLLVRDIGAPANLPIETE